MAQLKAGTTVASSLVLTEATHNNTGNPHDQYILTTFLFDNYYSKLDTDALLALKVDQTQLPSLEQDKLDAEAAAAAAQQSETNAGNSATSASSSASQASTSASNANTSAIAAATSESNALTSEQLALGHKDRAQEWAENPENLLITGTLSSYSSLHHAAKAAASATAASTSETNALNSANSASASATTSTNAAAAASTSETNAATSAANALTSEQNAAASAALIDTTNFVPQTDGAVGAARLPTGTIAQRPLTPTEGMFRRNSETGSFEGYDGTTWAGVGGASGGAGNPFVYEHDNVVTASYTIQAGQNAMSAGPLTINNGVVITVEDNATWVIV